MNKDGITYLNDPLLHNEKNKYIIRDTLNIYRSLVFPTEFDTKDWVRKTPYIVSQVLCDKLKRILNDQNLMERLIELIEKYTACKYVKKYSIPRWLLRQVKRGLINIVVLRCISILLNQNSRRNEKFFSTLLRKANYFTDYMHRTVLKLPLKFINLLDDANIYLAGCIVGDGCIGIKDQHVSISDGHSQKNY